MQRELKKQMHTGGQRIEHKGYCRSRQHHERPGFPTVAAAADICEAAKTISKLFKVLSDPKPDRMVAPLIDQQRENKRQESHEANCALAGWLQERTVCMQKVVEIAQDRGGCPPDLKAPRLGDRRNIARQSVEGKLAPRVGTVPKHRIENPRASSPHNAVPAVVSRIKDKRQRGLEYHSNFIRVGSQLCLKIQRAK